MAQYDMRLSITDIFPNNYDRQFVGLAFEKNASGEYKYSFIDKTEDIRDIVYIASAGLDDPERNPKHIEGMKAIVNQGVANVGNSLQYEISGETSAQVGVTVELTLSVAGLRLNAPTWELTSGEAEISPNGNTCSVYLTKTGETVIKAKTADGLISDEFTITATEIPLADGEITFVHNRSSADLFAESTDLSRQFVSSADLSTTYGITGNYAGNAVYMTMDATALPNVIIKPRITEAQYDEMVAKGATKMYIYLAAYADNGKPVRYGNNNSIYTGSPIAMTDKTWTKVEIALTATVKSGLFAVGKTGLPNKSLICMNMLKSGDVNNRVNADGSATTIHLFVGDIGFDTSTVVEENEIVFFKDASRLDKISVSDGLQSKTWVDSEALAENEISGAYTGNAVYLQIKSSSIPTIKITPRITEAQYDEAVTNGATKLTFYLAAYAENGKTVRGSSNNTIYSATSSKTLSKTWTKVEITLSDTVKTKLFGTTPLIAINMTNNERDTVRHVFISNISFE